MSLSLRPYQSGAIEAVEDARERGIGSGLIVLPTGTGKTVVFANLVRDAGSALILAHRDELLQQAIDKLQVVAPELAMGVGLIQGKFDDVGSPIAVASVPTLAREARLARLPQRWPLVVVDEAHHATAASYRRILEHLDAELVVGFTATPERSDDDQLSDVFDEVLYARSLLEMIEAGYLANLRGRRVKLPELDLSKVGESGGDYKADELADAMRAAHVAEHTAKALAEHAADRKTIAFLPSVALAHETAELIREEGITAGTVDGEMDLDKRRQVLRDFTAGRIQVLTNVDVCTEGYDEPSLECVAIAAPTKSRVRYVQRVGRGTRIHPGKEDCLILDLVGVTEELELQSLHDLFGVDVGENETVTEAVERSKEESFEGGEAPKQRGVAKGDREHSDVELFGRDRMSWKQLGGRWILPGGGDEQLVLDPLGDGAYRVLLLGDNRARILGRDLDLGYAQGAAEEAVRARKAWRLADKQAKWREDGITNGQSKYLRRLGVLQLPDTRGEASDLIDLELARERLGRMDVAVNGTAGVNVHNGGGPT